MKSKQKQKKSKGFTLIELLIVIAIIGLLAAVIFASLSNARVRARDARRLEDVREMISGLELYFSSNNNYPTQVAPQVIAPGISGGFGALYPNFVGTIEAAPLPVDANCTAPQNSYTYTSAAGTTYSITFCLSNKTGDYAPGPHTATPNGIN